MLFACFLFAWGDTPSSAQGLLLALCSEGIREFYAVLEIKKGCTRQTPFLLFWLSGKQSLTPLKTSLLIMPRVDSDLGKSMGPRSISLGAYTSLTSPWQEAGGTHRAQACFPELWISFPRIMGSPLSLRNNTLELKPFRNQLVHFSPTLLGSWGQVIVA